MLLTPCTLLGAIMGLLVFSSSVYAEPVWETRTFRVMEPVGGWAPPGVDLAAPANQDVFGERTAPDFQLPPLPSQTASDDEWLKCIREQTDLLLRSKTFARDEFPKGTLFLMDRGTKTLAVRTDAEGMEKCQELHEQMAAREGPGDIVICLEVMEAPAAKIRALIRDTTGLPDHTPHLKELQGAVGQGGGVRTLYNVQTGARSAAEAEFSEGEVSSPGPKDGDTASKSDEAFCGNLEEGIAGKFIPTIGRSGEVFLAFELDIASPPPARQQLQGDTPAPEATLPAFQDKCRIRLKSAMNLSSNAARLAAAWRPMGDAKLDAQDVMQVAFITVKQSREARLSNELVLRQLSRLADKLEPIPSGAKRNRNIPPGMLRRTFSVPADLIEGLSIHVGNLPKDPFDGSSKDNLRPASSLVEGLESIGITFPSGARAALADQPGFARLTMVNTLENLEFMETWLDALLWNPRAHNRQMFVTLEGDAEEMEKLKELVQASVDHQPVWRHMEQLAAEKKIRFTNTQLLAVASAAPAVIDVLREHRPVASNPSALREAAPEDSSVQKLGCRTEFVATVGPDSHTIDSTFALDHVESPHQIDGWILSVTVPGNLAARPKTRMIRSNVYSWTARFKFVHGGSLSDGSGKTWGTFLRSEAHYPRPRLMAE